MLIILILFIHVCLASLPDFIQVCRINDPNIDNCIVNSINALKPQLLKGIPEIHVPSYDPMIIPEINMTKGPNAVKFEYIVRNMSVHGPSKYEIISLKTNISREKTVVETMIYFPVLSIFADYQIDINILGIPIRGSGKLDGNFTNYKCEVIMKGNLVKRDGEEYLQFDKFTMNLILGESFLNLGGLFGGDNIFGEVANKMVNENSRLFLEEIKPALEDSLASLFTDIANRVAMTGTFDELFPQK